MWSGVKKALRLGEPATVSGFAHVLLAWKQISAIGKKCTDLDRHLHKKLC